MSSDLQNAIDNLDSKIERLRIFKSEMNKHFSNSAVGNRDNKTLIEAGKNQQHLIYNFTKNSFEFVDNHTGNNNDISIPFTHLTGGINQCNIYINRYLDQVKLTQVFLKKKQK